MWRPSSVKWPSWRAEPVYYHRNLAWVHHQGFGFHADACAPGILRLLEPVLERHGLVLEVGCGSGLFTRHLTDAGHRVLATDASDAMLDLAREHAPDATVEKLVLPDDPIPAADAIVSTGHVISYLPDEDSIDRALTALAQGLQPGGVLAIDLCDLEWGRARVGEPPRIWNQEDWFLVTQFAQPAPGRYSRDLTMFVRNPDGTWQRDYEHHDNVLIDTSRVPALLAEHGLQATVRPSFGDEQLPAGLVAIVGRRPG
jgi:SAM-dependent methyltransferase